MKLKKLLISMLAVVSLTIGSVGTACVGSGKIVRLQQGGGSVLIYLAPRTQFPSYHFRMYTANHDFLSRLDAAAADSRFVYYTTDGTDCTAPAAGASKVIGSLTGLDLFMDL